MLTHPGLKTFFNDRLAIAWYDPALRKAKLHSLADRAEPFALRVAPANVRGVVLSVDTQDDRLELMLTGWADGLECWGLDYDILHGDPFEDAVWARLTEYALAPVLCANGNYFPISATVIDAGGHRTHAVYNYVRSRVIPRPMAIFGAKDRRALPLSKAKPVDVKWRGQVDRQGVHIRQVGTIMCKDWIMGAIAQSADVDPPDRKIHFSEQLPPQFFHGLVTEAYRPETGRYAKKTGDDRDTPTARNEPLDLMVYAYAAIHHEELMWHKRGLERWPVPIEAGKKADRPKIWIPD